MNRRRAVSPPSPGQGLRPLVLAPNTIRGTPSRCHHRWRWPTKYPIFQKKNRPLHHPASSEVQALSISPLAGEQRAASAGGAIGSPGGAARRPRRPGDAVAYAVGERLAERVGVADARRGVAPADDLVADAGDVASSPTPTGTCFMFRASRVWRMSAARFLAGRKLQTTQRTTRDGYSATKCLR